MQTSPNATGNDITDVPRSSVWKQRMIDTIDFTVTGDLLFVYSVAAKLLGYKKENPDDPESMVWLNRYNKQMILTKTGFVPAEQFSLIEMYKKATESGEKHLRALQRIESSQAIKTEELSRVSAELEIVKNTCANLQTLLDMTKKEVIEKSKEPQQIKDRVADIIDGKRFALVSKMSIKDAAMWKVEMIKNFLRQL